MDRWKDDQAEERPSSLSTGVMIAHLVTIAEQGGDHELAWRAFDTFRQHRNAFTGLPSDNALRALVEGCLEAGEASQAVEVAAFMDSLEMAGVAEAAQLITDSGKVALTQAHRDTLANL